MRMDNIAVAGFGKTGRALLDFLLKSAEQRRVMLFNDTPLDTGSSLVSEYQKRGVTFFFGEKGLKELFEVADTMILSPGVNGLDSRFDGFRNMGKPILSEIEFASRYIDAKIVAVTGTNGKSTTVSLIHHFIKAGGFNSVLAGNIGTPFISQLENIGSDSVVVLELSSFQLEEIVDFKADIALILNITPDHLDRYSDITAYMNAKLKIFKNQEPADYLVLNEDCPLVKKIEGGRGQRIRFTIDPDGNADAVLAFPDFKFTSSGVNARLSLKKCPLSGVHNMENLAAAATVALLAGVSPEAIENALPGFKGLTHRMEFAGELNGVRFVNDSKATNVDAALKSAKSFDDDLVIIVGGKDKGGEYKALDAELSKRAKKVLLIGASAQKIGEQLTLTRSRSKIRYIDQFSEGIRVGYDLMKTRGGTLLLAPACASFDMFDNFEHRGEVFKQAVSDFIESEARSSGGRDNG